MPKNSDITRSQRATGHVTRKPERLGPHAKAYLVRLPTWLRKAVLERAKVAGLYPGRLTDRKRGELAECLWLELDEYEHKHPNVVESKRPRWFPLAWERYNRLLDECAVNERIQR